MVHGMGLRMNGKQVECQFDDGGPVYMPFVHDFVHIAIHDEGTAECMGFSHKLFSCLC